MHSGHCASNPFAFALFSNEGLVGGCEGRGDSASVPAAHPPPHQLPRAPGEAGTEESDSEGRADALLTPRLLLHSPGCLEGFFWPEELTPGFQVGTTSPQRLGAQVFILALGRHLQKQPLGFRLHAPPGVGAEGGWGEGNSELCWSQKSEGYTCPSLLHCQQEPSPSPRSRGSACWLCLPRKSPSGQAEDTALLGPHHPWGHGSLGPPLHLGRRGDITSERLRDLSRALSQQDRAESPPPAHGHLACQAHYCTDPGRRQSAKEEMPQA